MTQQLEEPAFSVQEVPSRMVQLAIEFGHVKTNYTLEDYLVEAAETGGYETLSIWGVQGSFKSNRLLATGFWVYKDWDKVLANLEFKPKLIVKKLRSIPKGKRLPWVGWDDIGVHYPSSTFKTDIQEYEAIDAAWAAIRPKCSIVVTTIPIIDRLAKNIKDNVTFEVYEGRNKTEIIYRIMRLPAFNMMGSNLFKILIEPPKRFNIYDVPTDVFKEYWERRLILTEEALETLDKTVAPESHEGFLTVLDAAQELEISPNTLQQMISRNVVAGRKIKGRLYVDEEDFERLKQQEHLKGRKPSIKR